MHIMKTTEFGVRIAEGLLAVGVTILSVGVLQLAMVMG
jgi:hypothetical protein